MEETLVVIVGAGPAGLALGLSLAKHEIYSLILEKEPKITEDPRGVFLAGDAVRILVDLGIGEHLSTIGHQADTVNFHESDFRNPPFFTLETSRDFLNQSVPDGIFHVQPKLEYILRCEVQKSQFCELRCSSTVRSREESNDGVVVDYSDENNVNKLIKCAFLVGADGKKGIVRKKFLEPTANVHQEVGLYAYEGTWVAANLKIHLPTPETHPKFPLWKLGFTPERVYDLFWPTGWHFCCPPGKPTATGRFGPVSERLWRHEFAEPNWNDSMDSVALLWEHLLPMVTRNSDERGNVFPDRVTFPQDCIEIRRCRPFMFCQKVVNKWFHNRTILIGDAAHVFPPFGGQGIACGVRDAHTLAWRLALLLRLPNPNMTVFEKVLNAWALERRQGVDDSTRLTLTNGKFANEPLSWTLSLALKTAKALAFLRITSSPASITHTIDVRGYKATKAGFFLAEYGGGGKMAQIYVRPSDQKPFLSDHLLKRSKTLMSLLVIGDDVNGEKDHLKALLSTVNLHPSVVSEESVFFFNPEPMKWHSAGNTSQIFYPCLEAEVSQQLRPGYEWRSYMERLGPCKYALIRPDYIVFAIAKTPVELERCLGLLKQKLGSEEVATSML